MILDVTPQVIGVGVSALVAMFAGGYYLGDTRWVRKRDWETSSEKIVASFEEIRLKLERLDGTYVARREWHDENSRQCAIIGKIELSLRDHETQLAQGAMIMNTLSGNVNTLTTTIGSLNIALARMEGMHAASGKGC